MRMNRWLMVAGLAAGLGLGINNSLAQDNGGGQGGQGGPGGGWRNMTPEERQQRMQTMIKDQLEITDDSEWKAIQPLVQKAMDARMGMGGPGGGMGRMFARPQGGDQGGNGGGGRRGGGMFGGTPMPEAEALQKAIDAKASKAEIKAALTKYQEARKTKQAELEKAQEELRKVLTARQEAIATLIGWL